MKAHSNNFKIKIKELGRELDNKITYSQNGTEIILTNEELNSVNPHYSANLLKSVMKQLDIDSNIDIPKETIINYKFGLKIGSSYEYLNFGNYVVYESEYSEDTKSYRIICYDKMLYTMVDYDGLKHGDFPMTIKEYEKNLCLDLGLIFKDDDKIFANHDKILTNDIYKDLEYKYRDIFDELSQVTASTICLDTQDQLENRYINNTNDSINEEYFKDTNVIFKEKYGPINSIVLSRSAESDNVYLQNEASVQQNGLCEIKIKDNQIMNFNNRDEFLPDILEKLNGLEFYLNDFQSTGIIYYDMCDKYTVQIAENTYSCVMLNDEINIMQGLEENILTEKPNESVTDYSKADKTDRRIDQAWLIVNKQEKKINALVSTTTEQQEQIQDIKTPIKEIEGKNHLCLHEALEDELIDYKIYGKSVQETEPSLEKSNKIQTINGVLDEQNTSRYLKIHHTNKETDEESTKIQNYLIDLKKENLFDINSNFNLGYISSTGVLTAANNNIVFDYIEVKSNTKYTFNINRKIEGLVIVYYDENKSFISREVITTTNRFITSSNVKFIRPFFNLDNITTMSKEIVKNLNPFLFEGDEEFYELCEIKNVRDKFNVLDGKLFKNVGTIILDGNNEDTYSLISGNSNEEFIQINYAPKYINNFDSSDLGSYIMSSHFKYYKDSASINKNETGIRLFNTNLIVFSLPKSQISTTSEFKNWLKSQKENGTPIKIYYKLNEEQHIQLEPTKITLFEGENHLELEEEIETDTSIRYQKKTAFNEIFYTRKEANSEFEMLNESITNRVSEVNTTINNNQMIMNDKLNDYATNETVTQQISSVENKITSSDQKISIINETLENGISQVRTEKGYTFDDKGLLIDDSNSKSKNLLNEVGMTITDKSTNGTLLFAGYDEESQESIVKSKNMTVEKYLVIPNCRFESYQNQKYGKGTGVFDL